jgi:hypothetical protein
MRRAIAALAIALLACAAIVATAIGQNGDVLISDTQKDADYHAEGRIKEGGDLQIQSDRAPATGQALQNGCDPDPRPDPNNRPTCSWGTPQGSGREQVNLPGQIGRPDTDRSPNGSYTRDESDTREILNGLAALQHDHSASAARRSSRRVKARAAQSGQRFEGHFFDDEDMHFRLTPRTLDAYLAPESNANNRWRRICGTGVVEQFNNSGNGNNDPRSPFLEGQIRKFVLQIWDADWREPSNSDGGNQDYFIIDVFPPGTTFDVASCVAKQPPNNPPNNPPAKPPVKPNPNPTPVAATPVAATPAQTAVRGTRAVARGRAQIAGARTCPVSAFNVRVTGRQIRRVTFTVDGRRVATVTRADRLGRWQARVNPRGLRTGLHRVQARVEFHRGAGSARTLRTSFRTCARPAAQVAPSFTG